ncbi:hypothetical protein [Streptosporangium jomthongense]|uniref:AsnC family protein n=1 Tax=Streptosporangium jomthongense TaxID=1193683 RepID=A0ABV8FE62_9ACTN
MSVDHPGHEGWDAPVLPGGWYGVGAKDGRALARRFADAPGPLQEDGEASVQDGRHVVGWQAMCECGWRGPRWTRVDQVQDADEQSRLVHVPDLDSYGDAPDHIVQAIYDEWQEHLEPPLLLAVRDASQEAAAAQDRLAAAVAAARAEHSWADIGAVIGISRQAAHERWSKITG